MTSRVLQGVLSSRFVDAAQQEIKSNEIKSNVWAWQRPAVALSKAQISKDLAKSMRFAYWERLSVVNAQIVNKKYIRIRDHASPHLRIDDYSWRSPRWPCRTDSRSGWVRAQIINNSQSHAQPRDHISATIRKYRYSGRNRPRIYHAQNRSRLHRRNTFSKSCKFINSSR